MNITDSNESLKTAMVVADDEVLVRKSISAVLEKAGFSIVTAATGATALKICGDQERPVDLAVIDAGTASIEPAEIAQQLCEICPRVLFLSDDPTGSEVQEIPVGRCGRGPSILRKPFRRAQLLAHVLRLMDQPLVRTA